jgi:hypothetical protein
VTGHYKLDEDELACEDHPQRLLWKLISALANDIRQIISVFPQYLHQSSIKARLMTWMKLMII